MKLRQSGHFGDVSHIGFPRTDGPHLLSAFSCPRYTIQISYLGLSVRHTLDPVSRLFPISAHVDINDGPNTLLILTTGKDHLIRNVSVRENPSARTSLRGISPSGDAWSIPFSPSTVPHLAFDFAVAVVERLVHSFGNTVVKYFAVDHHTPFYLLSFTRNRSCLRSFVQNPLFRLLLRARLLMV